MNSSQGLGRQLQKICIWMDSPRLSKVTAAMELRCHLARLVRCSTLSAL